jgi:TPR repeat protein
MDLMNDYYPRAALEKYLYWMDNKEYDKVIEHFELHRPFNSLFKDDFYEYYNWKNIMSQNVGYIYHVITKEYDKAIEVYNSCISNGGSMNNLGFLYEYNLNDLNKAFEAYKKSAEYNDPAGIWSLAQCYYYGKGTSVNMTEFKKYHELAKSLNVKDAIDFKY